jgi:hypothetical protein
MSKNNPLPTAQVFSIAVADAENMAKQTSTQLSLVEDLILDFGKFDMYSKRRSLLALLGESHSVNHKLNVIVSKLLEQNPREEHEGVEEILIKDKEMLLIQTLTMSQYMINLEMVKDENISTSLH